jgi:alkanesulfonate monooxygenase SsuD/methylene tetrahydromethanopterin reductase-like flavin-dependent oxidoreductase (luciferase family)
MVGASVPQFDMLFFQESPWPTLRDEVGFLEETDIGTVWVADHYAFPPRPTAPVLEAWTTLAALEASTSRVRLGTMVSNVATRHPAMLAKMASTVDAISGGRVDLGVGAGGGDGLYKREYDWLGIPPLSRRFRDVSATSARRPLC